MSSNHLPTREELFADKTWALASRETRIAHGFTLAESRASERKKDNWYEAQNTKQLGYVKHIVLQEAFCEHLASRLASCAGLRVPQIDIAPFHPEANGYGKQYACFSPLLGTQPRTLKFFAQNEAPRLTREQPDIIDRISADISALIPFWILAAHQDVQTENIIVASLGDNAAPGAYNIDNAALSFKRNANVFLNHYNNLACLYTPSMLFRIDTDAMRATAETILSAPQEKIQEAVESSFRACKISPDGIPEDEKFYALPSLPEIQDILLGRRDTLIANIETPDYMAKIFKFPTAVYQRLSERKTPPRPQSLIIAKAAPHAR